MQEINFQDIIVGIIEEYFQIYEHEPVIPTYIICEDMCKSYRELRPKLEEKEPEKFKTLNSYNGITVPPYSVDERFTVLLNRQIIIENMHARNANWVGTIAHETTHVIDFSDYAKLIDATDYEDILQMSKHGMFNLWTEFNARAKGYYFVRKYTFDNMFDTTQISDIVNIELPAQDELLYKNYHATTDGFQQAYYVSHYLGRLYSLQQIFPTYFTDEFINEIQLFKHNKWMLDWFFFLKNHTSLNKAYQNFGEMKEILKQNFCGL